MGEEGGTMFSSLGRVDLERALLALGALSECAASEDQFARNAVACLPRLVASDLTTLSICDLATGQRRVMSDVPAAIPACAIQAFDRHFHEHPLVRAHGRNPDSVTRRMSDLVSFAQFERSALFDEYYRPIGIAHVMAVPVHVRGHELVSFVLNRSRRDFSERERDCLELIRAHLGNLFRVGREMEGARAAWGVPAAGAVPLTAREHQVLSWLCAAKTDRDIAGILGISHRTVHKHLQRIYEKLGVETRTAAVARWMARRHG
jgi:DNA-binding CsgD family transcriptional regulator